MIPKVIGDFLLSLWIWHITYDLFHPVVTAITMAFMLHFLMNRGWGRSFGIALFAQLEAIIALTLVVPIFLVTILDWQYEPLDVPSALSMLVIFMPSLSLGLFYAIAQAFFFIIGRLFFRYSLPSYLLLIVVSNGIGVLLSFLLIRAIQFAYYVG